MPDDGTGLGRIERSIYVVGAIVLGLFGIQSLSTPALQVYNFYAVEGARFPVHKPAG